MMTRGMKPMLCAGICVLLVATVGYAKRQTFEYDGVLFPGVDDSTPPELDDNLGGEGTLKVTINVKNDRITARGRATVQNLSGKKFKVKKLQAADVESYLEGTELEGEDLKLKRGSYVVAKPKKTINKEPNPNQYAAARFAAAGKIL